ncbi:MAG: acyl-[acyl-carrier-protein]--UDP-N-acetylglucosamine O-acyltransferase, partial [Rhizobiales bacterium]|nr:acyl-[acyl-carrier-protein]--UDP-N-acetylglucosamine O-acyltransferase [Hyphomicrobiales bacterium]
MSGIHSTAYVEDGASIGEGVEIGPFSVVGHEVSLGAGVRIHAHVVITGRTSVG